MNTQRQHVQIDFGHVFEALERPLALIDDPERRGVFQRYVDSARVHLERAIFDLLSSAVEAVNEAGGNVRTRLEYQAGGLHLVVEPVAEEAAAEQDHVFNIDDEVEKVTIRIPGELKELISQAANLRGVSINSWYIRELARAVRDISREMRQDERQGERQARRGQKGAEREARRAQQEAEREQRRAQGGRLRGFIGRD